VAVRQPGLRRQVREVAVDHLRLDDQGALCLDLPSAAVKALARFEAPLHGVATGP
jgi:hypothetical protein